MSVLVSCYYIFGCVGVVAGEGRDIELRHQRNPDVVFDYIRAVQGEAAGSGRQCGSLV
jgi:hypothetical protein